MTLDSFFADRSLRVPDDSLGFLLWRVTHAWQRYADQRLESCGLTHLQFALLVGLGWLTRMGEPSTQSVLVAFLDMHPMQVSQVLGHLERKDLVARDRNPQNARTKRVALTAAGAEALQRAMPIIEDAHRAFFAADGVHPPGLRAALQSLIQTDPGQASR